MNFPYFLIYFFAPNLWGKLTCMPVDYDTILGSVFSNKQIQSKGYSSHYKLAQLTVSIYDVIPTNPSEKYDAVKYIFGIVGGLLL